jgi:thioester reductase-like protein
MEGTFPYPSFMMEKVFSSQKVSKVQKKKKINTKGTQAIFLPLPTATTFIGRLFIEKLLRSCPGIENIYVLIRPEKGEDIQEIVDEVVLKAPIFDKIRQTRPDDLKKVVPIKGDMTVRWFGITLEDLELLKDKVSVILHSSFLYRTNEPLKEAVERNLLPTKELIKMCHYMKKLDVRERMKNYRFF